MAAVLAPNPAHADRIAQLDASRRRARFWRYLRYALIAGLVGWSVEAIVVGDTDWSRISAAASARVWVRSKRSAYGSLPAPRSAAILSSLT